MQFFGCTTLILPALIVSPLKRAQQRGADMKIGRVIAVAAAVCATIGMATQAEAAKRKGLTTFTGCAGYRLCGPFGPVLIGMTDIAGNFYVFNPPGSVRPLVPYRVRGLKLGNPTSIGWCTSVTQVNVVSATQIGPPGNCPVSLR